MKTGVIGLGSMGAHMALNLHKAGHLYAVWNRTREKAERIAADTGALLAETPGELAGCCEFIVISVSRDLDVKGVIEALLPNIHSGAVVADTSTVSADTAKEVAARLRERDAAYLDCPVSGGVEGAKNGTLAMMIGGEATALEQVRAPLSAIAAIIVHMGPTGSGQATKAVNQIMAAGINQAVSESLAFGQAMGLSMDKVLDVIESGAASNWFLSHRGKTMLAGKFLPGFKVRLHHKDLEICRDMARKASSAALPIVEMTLNHYQRLMEAGYGDEDISALFRLKRQQYQDLERRMPRDPRVK
ncbi:MAG: NAD(P)-dependent oxidoreductase [Gammaproteobacteria bacterium]|nr:NAD(P)-dependent oxidoreductase [Gammaproteobacteria bacterium]MCI0591534.1 NAD(P)-dependent oxidoreductase [Gammaproteobacteria bacterium]